MFKGVSALFLIMIFALTASFLMPSEAMADVSPKKGMHSMPSTGTVKALAIRVGFKDYPLFIEEEGDDGQVVVKDSGYCLTREDLTDSFLGTAPGSEAQYPYESLSAYYNRSSYGKLDIELGEIVDYTSEKDRDYYAEKEAGVKEIELMSEILDFLEDKIDLSDYDSDGDGVADAVYVFYSGRPGPSVSKTFSPHCRRCSEHNMSLDGIKVTHFVMMGLDEKSVLMHETGHLLGLPDYYSKANGEALFGTSDMMYDNSGDHNGFSKWILGWIGDENVIYLDKNDAGNIVSLTSVDSLDCEGKKLAVLSNPKAKGPYGTYLLVEYVSAENDMADIVGGTFPEGFRIFRVDAQLSDDLFVRNNDYYETALLQVLNHDYSSFYDSIYREGMEVTPFTDPSSAQADGTYTGFFILDFETGENNSFRLDYREKMPETTTSKETEPERETSSEKQEEKNSYSKRIKSADTGDKNSHSGYLFIVPMVILCGVAYVCKRKVKKNGTYRS